MKFSLFAHMERVSGTQSHHQLYSELKELVKLADSGGMHAFWTGEHHGMEYTITPNPFHVLIDLAHHTKNLRLGTGTIVAPFWHPIKLAGEAALADLITQGRIELGIARGAYSFEYERLSPGLDAWQAGQKMRELAPLLPKLWQGDCANETGAYYPFPNTSACPRPYKGNSIPIWVAARDPNSHAFALEHDFNVQVTPLWKGDDEITALMNKYKQAAAALGKRSKIMLLQHAYIAQDAADQARGAAALSEFYHYFFAWFKNERPIQQGRIAPLSPSEMNVNPEITAQTLAQSLLVGDIERVLERLKSYQALGFDEYALWLDNGLPFEVKKRQLLLFIDKILPHF